MGYPFEHGSALVRLGSAGCDRAVEVVKTLSGTSKLGLQDPGLVSSSGHAATVSNVCMGYLLKSSMVTVCGIYRRNAEGGSGLSGDVAVVSGVVRD